MRQGNSREALAYPQVKVVHGAGFHPDEDLVFAWAGVGDVFIAEHFRSAELVNADGFHGLPFKTNYHGLEADSQIRNVTLCFPWLTRF
jgi:hypothetical protein